jgi:ACS family tartrate transporter-like MFS transporter
VAGGIALVNSMGNIGGFIAPFTIGWIRQTTGSFTDALLVLAGAMAVSGVIAFLIRPTLKDASLGIETGQPI